MIDYAKIGEVRAAWPGLDVNVFFLGETCVTIKVSNIGCERWNSGECETLEEACEKAMPTYDHEA